MTRWTIRRTYLIRRCQTFECDMPDDMDPEHLVANHPLELSVDLDNGGDPLNGWTAKKLVEEEEEAVEYDETKLEVIARRAANVIPIGRKRP